MKKLFRNLSIEAYDMWKQEPTLFIPLIIGFLCVLLIFGLIVWGLVELFLWSVGWFFILVSFLILCVAIPTIFILFGKFYSNTTVESITDV